jgi:hypothetical protein
MFYCQATKKLSKPNEPAHKLVTHVRNRAYTRWNHKKNDHEVIGHGVEVVREILVCREYYEKCMAEGFQPQVVREKNG